jgi:glycosyltransferase involved in cell wall biosynthesis
MKPKIAFVVQRCGKEVNGGAETHCLLMAQKMLEYWDVEILTTCALDYLTWENHYQAGPETIGRVIVKRFKVDYPRDLFLFNEYSKKLFSKLDSVTHEESEKWMYLQGPLSSGLLDYIDKNREHYDYFIFFTYLYATTYFGLPLVQKKALLVPTAHDERPIYLPLFKRLFDKPRAYLYNTNEEKRFLENKFGIQYIKNDVVGVGVVMPTSISEERFRSKYKITGPYMVYIGRINENKGCQELFDYFLEYKNEMNNSLKLLLIGRSSMAIPRNKDIIALGFVDEDTKYDALKGCELLVNPSSLESLSMVLLEAWSLNKPTLVSEKCAVMVSQSKRSNSGLWYADYYEFKECVNYILKNKYVNKNAYKFVEENYSWGLIQQKYLKILESIHSFP